MKQLIATTNNKQQFYLGRIYFLIFGLMLLLFATKQGTYSLGALVLGLSALILTWKFNYFIKNKIIIYSFLAVVGVLVAYVILLNFSITGLASPAIFLFFAFIIVLKVKEVPEEDLAPKKVPTKSLMPFFLITLTVTVVLVSFLLWLNFSN